MESNEARITQAEFGDRWPFSVAEGVLRCDGSGGTGAVTFEAGGTVYALNGIARGDKSLPEVDPIWLADPSVPPEFELSISLGPIISRGLELCQ